jgi:hypothetical protein
MEFLAIDGEAIDDSYVLLAASNGEHVIDLDGLTTRACLDFLLSLAKPQRKIVCFGLNYDVNQWISGIGKPTLRELWATGNCIWRNYKISWLPRRWFTIRSGGRSVRITEVWGFFQSSFVAALENWEIAAQSEIVEGKRKRGEFMISELPQIVDYCHRECTDLVELCQRLRLATVQAECEPRDWIGAGALAGAMLKTRDLEKYHAHDGELTDSDACKEAIMCAYFGGRVEAFRVGSYQPVQSQDLRSAYPFAATLLPSLSGATLKRVRKYDPAAEHAIWRVRWRDLDGQVMPFPVRNSQSIYYPRNSEGFYHACEVAAALAAGFPLTIDGGWVLCDPGGAPVRVGAGASPFSWIPDAYAIRARWKAEGNAAEKALKLGLNSLYGKLAQGVGYRGGPPRWQSYLWAGEITARTRAAMLTATLKATDPISIATDGLYASRVIGRDSSKLGGWERGAHDSLFIAQPGLYAAETDGRVTVRSRGHFAKEVDYEALRSGFQSDGFEHVHRYTSRRFIGLGTALMRRDMRLWRHWPDERRSISLYPTRKLPGADGRLDPPDGGMLDPSEPYVPKRSIQDTEQVDNIQAAEQPLRSEE